MAVGPGKYDQECMYVMRQTDAKLVAVVVVDGDRGSGFSVTVENYPHLLRQMPALLRSMANQIERDAKNDIRQATPRGDTR